MEGVIDHTLRALLTGQGGVDRCVTEFVRVSDLLLPERVFRRFCPELDRGGQTRNGTPVYLQLLGGNPEAMAENAARAAAMGAPGIDLNFGCPAKTVNRSMGGAVLLDDPARVTAIVQAVRAAVPADIPVTVKIRLGFKDRSCLQDNCQGIAAAGANELTVHARTRADGYRVPAYWEEVARVREWVDIPLIANGEIWSVEDAYRCRQVSGVEDLMLGRGVLSRPDLARLIRARDAGSECQALAWPQVQQLVSSYLDSLCQHYPLRYAANPIKQWLMYLRNYYPQAGALFEQVKRLKTPAEIRACLLAVAA